MRAVQYRRFGPPDVLEVVDIPGPPTRSVRSPSVRVAVAACALNPKDVLIRKGKMTWLTGRKMPRIPGYDFAGTLLDPVPESDAHAALAAGTRVFGMVQHHSGGPVPKSSPFLRTSSLRCPRGPRARCPSSRPPAYPSPA